MAACSKPRAAVVLAHGRGDRCFPFGGEKAFRPKYAHEVGNVPLVRRVVDAVLGAGIEHVTVVAGFRAERIRRLLETAGARVSVIETPAYRDGDARVLSQALQAESIAGDLLVANGDLLAEPRNFDRAVETFVRAGTCALVDELDENEDQPSWTTVELDAGGDRIQAVLGRVPDGRMRLSGLYVFAADALRSFAELPAAETPVYITEVVRGLVESKCSVAAVRASGTVVHVDRPFDYLDANQTAMRWAVERIANAAGAYVYVGGDGQPDPEFIFPGCLISPGARIVMHQGSFIGPYDTRQAHLAAARKGPQGILPIRIRGNVHLGPGSRIGLNALLEGNLAVGENSYLEDCVVEPNVLVGSGVVIRRNAVIRGRTVCADNTRFECGADFEGVAGNGTIYMHPGQCWVVTGEKCDLGAGNFFGTWRFDDAICTYVIDGRKVRPRCDAIGNASCLGDGCRTGVGVMVAPGTLMGPDTMVGIGVLPSGRVEAGFGYLAKQDVVKVRAGLLTKKKRSDG